MTRSIPPGAALRRAALATLLGLGPVLVLPAAAAAGAVQPVLPVQPHLPVQPILPVQPAQPVQRSEPVGARSTAPRVTPDSVRAVVTISTVKPAIMRIGGYVDLKGTVTAPLSGPLTGSRLKVVLGDVVDRRADVASWAAGTASVDGDLVRDTALPEVAAGASVPFSVRIDASDVNPGQPFAVLPLSLEVLQRGAKAPIGTARTFVPWREIKEYVPLEVAMVMPLTLDPSASLFSSEPSVRATAWQSAIGPGSRVARIVDGTSEAEVTLAVDSALFGAAPGSPRPTTHSATDELATALASSLKGRSLWALPYADADLAAGVDLDPANPLMRDLVSRSSVLAATVGQPARADIAWPVDGLLPAGREGQLRSLYGSTLVKGPAGIIVNQADITVPSDVTPGARRVGTGGTRLLGYDPVLSKVLAGLTPETVATSTQRYLAESMVMLGELPGKNRSVLVVTPRTFNPDPSALATFLATTGDADWLTPVRPDSLLTDSDGEQATKQQRPPKAAASAAPAPVLTTARMQQLADQRNTLLRVAAVLRDGDQFERTYREVLDELGSARWRYRPSSWATLSNSVRADTKAATSAIRVVGGRKVNFLAENGTIRVTVANGLDYAVRDIRLVLTPSNPRMQVVQQPAAFSIPAGPGAKKDVEVQLRAVAAGRADIVAQLVTADGTPIGLPATIGIGANPLDSTIYWVGGVLVGLVLLAGIVRTVRKGTSRIDEIGDLETVAERDEAAEERKRA